MTEDMAAGGGFSDDADYGMEPEHSGIAGEQQLFASEGGNGVGGPAEDADEAGGRSAVARTAAAGAYELAATDDFPVPAENLASFAARARTLGLTKAQAEGMLAWHKEFHTSVTGALQQEEARTLENWAKEMRADRDFGGSRWKATVADARRALDAFDVDGSLRALLRDSRYQYNPTVIRAVARVGRALGEHAFVGRNGEGTGRDIPLEERMYPDMKI